MHPVTWIIDHLLMHLFFFFIIYLMKKSRRGGVCLHLSIYWQFVDFRYKMQLD